MGISKKVFEATGGFKFSHLAEDVELSIRMRKAGFRIALIPDAFVYHKRRTNFREFYRQVYSFGRGRVMVGRAHPEEIKLAHWFPTVFISGVFVTILISPLYPTLSLLGVIGYLSYFLLIFFDSLKVNRNFSVAILSIPSAFLQLWGYGTGFFREWLRSYTT